MKRRLRLAREFVALGIAFLAAMIFSVALTLDENTAVDFLKGILREVEDG